MISFTRSSPSLDELLARGIYTIPAGLPFAQDLAVGILASVQTPEQLAEIKILLPSRRAAQASSALRWLPRSSRAHLWAGDRTRRR